MTSETTYRVDKKDMDAFMQDYGSEMVLLWLCGNRVSSHTVCDILKISEGTLRNWIKDGSLTVLNEGKKHHEFDLSDVVRFFIALRERASKKGNDYSRMAERKNVMKYLRD